MGDKTFLKITNRDIYLKLLEIEKSLSANKTSIKILYAGVVILFILAGIFIGK